MLRDVIVVMINSASIIPSRHSRVDIRWDRNIRVPSSEKVYAKIILSVTDVIFDNYDCIHNLMSRNHLF